jgi:hypothetical protein
VPEIEPMTGPQFAAWRDTLTPSQRSNLLNVCAAAIHDDTLPDCPLGVFRAAVRDALTEGWRAQRRLLTMPDAIALIVGRLSGEAA